MNDTLTIDCGPADNFGRRVVMASCGPMDYRDRFQTDDAFRRRKFAEAMLEKFAWAVTQEILAEIDAKIIGVADREDARSADSGALSLESVRVADVPKSDVAWLWPSRIALGKVTLLAGDPGLGKSFVTLDIAARVSRCAAWPEEYVDESLRDSNSRLGETRPRGAASVVLLSAEDDVADTIRPRLEAHAADCERIHVVRSVAAREAANKYRRSFDLSRDLDHLKALFDRVPDCRLLVIDPVSAYLGRNIENTNSEVRGLLGPLAALAAERNLAVLAVTHLRKEEGAAMYRTMGSMAFIAAARAAWIVCKDKDDPRRRLLLPVKNNLASDSSGLAYTIEPQGPGGEAVVCWSSDTIDTPADVAMDRPSRPVGRPSDERAEVAEWLEEFLTNGPQPAAEVREAALGQGFTHRTLRRAFRELGGMATRVEGKNEWQWALPDRATGSRIEGREGDANMWPEATHLMPAACLADPISSPAVQNPGAEV